MEQIAFGMQLNPAVVLPQLRDRQKPGGDQPVIAIRLSSFAAICISGLSPT